MKLSFEQAEELLIERGAGKALKWRDSAAEKKKKKLVRKYNKLIAKLEGKRDRKLAVWNKELAALNEKYRTAREGYMKAVTDAKITELTIQIADVEENEQIRRLQLECESECKHVDEDMFDDADTDSSVGSDIEEHIEKLKAEGLLTDDHELVKKVNMKKAPVVEEVWQPKPAKAYDELNKSFYAQTKALLLSKLAELGAMPSEEVWDKLEAKYKLQRKKFRRSVDLMEIRMTRFFSIYAGDFSELQKEMMHELHYQYLQYHINEAKRAAEMEYASIERIRERWGGASLKKMFDGWKFWVRDKHRRERRDLRLHWRRVLRSFESGMER